MHTPLRSTILALFTTLLVVGCSHEPTSRAALESDFKSEYGFSPSAQITTLRCKIVVVGDTWSKWMLFTYDEPTVTQITSAGFTKATPAELNNPWGSNWAQDLFPSQPNPNAPEWFHSPDRGIKVPLVYYKLGHPNDYAGYKVIWIDETNKTVYAASAAWH